MTGGGTPSGAHPAGDVSDMIGRVAVGPAGVLGVAAVLAGELRLPGPLVAASVAAIAAIAMTSCTLHAVAFPTRLRRALIDVGVTAKVADGRRVAPRRVGAARRNGTTVTTRWVLPPGVSLRNVMEHKEAVEERARCELWCWIDDGHLVLEAQHGRIPAYVSFDEFYSRCSLPGPSFLGLGIGRRGPLAIDLRRDPHLLIGGITGGGKSVLLRQALTATLMQHRPDEVRVLAVDLKGGVELAIFDGQSHLMRPVVTTMDDAADALGEVRNELDSRLAALRAHAVSDLDGLGAVGLPALPRVLVVVDELAELTLRDPGESRAARDAQRAAIGRLCEIARLGRAAGIHLLVCTQRPDAEAVPGQLKANLATTVAFRVRSRVNSDILLDDDRAARLPHRPGRALWAHERIEEFQAVHLARGDAVRLLNESRSGGSANAGGAPPVTPHRQTTRAYLGEHGLRGWRGRLYRSSGAR